MDTKHYSEYSVLYKGLGLKRLEGQLTYNLLITDCPYKTNVYVPEDLLQRGSHWDFVAIVSAWLSVLYPSKQVRVCVYHA